MALVDGTTQLGFKFITTASWNGRASGETPAALTAEELASGDIIFIEATNQIFAGGAYFGVTPKQAEDLSTLWSDIETADTGLKAKVTNLEEKVGTEAKLSQTLLAIANDLKSKLDGGSYTGEGTAGTSISVTKTVEGKQVAVTNVTEAVNELFTRLTAMVAGVSQVNGKTGNVNLTGADIAVSSSNSTKIDVELGNKVAISTNTTVGAHTGKKATDYTNTKVIGDAIEAAHAAAANAQSEAEGKIAKSADDTTAKTLSGAKGSDLTTAAAIATAIETAYERILKDSSNQAQTNWQNGELKTLTTLRNLISTLRTDLTTLSTTVGTLSDADFASITDAINKIKAELNDPANGSLVTFLDTVKTITGGAVASGDNKGKYATKSGAGGANEYAANLGQIITNLEKEITAAKTAGENAGVTKITAGNGITASNNGVGNVTVAATSAATLTASLTSITNGATTTQGSTVQTALNDINAKAAKGITDANAAATAAGNAQTDATNALNQLKWIVV